jgi:iron complex transport system substrate-binding protein
MLNGGRTTKIGRKCFYSINLRVRLWLIALWLFVGFCTTLHATSQDSYPHRIISLGPTITEKLFMLGVEDRVVGVTIYCRRPPEAALKEKVGNVTHVSVEKIIRLKPDLVLATALTDSHLVKKLRQAHIRTEVFPEPKSFEEMNRQFIDLGKIVGKDQEAREIVALAENKVRAVSHRVAGQRRPKVFCQIGANPLFAAVGNTLLNDFIEHAKGVNIAREARVGFYNREEVVRQNPDVIIIVTMGMAAENEKRSWQKFKGVNAVRNGRVFVVDAYRTCSPTPLSFADALAEIAAALHPDANVSDSNDGHVIKQRAGRL